jgi:hypothetical protein
MVAVLAAGLSVGGLKAYEAIGANAKADALKTAEFDARIEAARASLQEDAAAGAQGKVAAKRPATCADAIDAANYAIHHDTSEAAITAQTTMLRMCNGA